MASERSPISTATDPHLLNKLSTTTIAFFARSGGLSDVTGINQPHLTVEHGRSRIMRRTEHQTPSGRCRYGIGPDDDALFICPLTREMVQFRNIFW
jgi:hypothetical protein